MIKPAFSTVACPEWTLEKLAALGAGSGFEALELRTFGERATRLACDPAMSDEAKARRTLVEGGLEIASLATSLRFDAPIRPPVIGTAIADNERSVRAAKRAVDMAAALRCPFVRMFVFELPFREKRPRAEARILQRLGMVLDHAHNTGVRITLENGGSYAKGRDLAALIKQAGSPLLGACYSLAAAWAEHEAPPQGIEALGERLWSARIKDWAGRKPAKLGEGELPCVDFVRALAQAGFDGPLIYEWDRLWMPSLTGPEQVLPEAARTLFGWIEGAGTGGGPGATPDGRVRTAVRGVHA